MKKIIKKSEKGITLILLVITIIVLGLISVTVSVNISQINKLTSYTKFKADMEKLNEAVSIAYKNLNDISTIGPKYTGSETISNCLSSIDATDSSLTSASSVNPNDSGDYYIINLSTLNSKLLENTKISLNYGEVNKTCSANGDYASFDNQDVYIINQMTKTIYYVKGIIYNSKIYHNLPTDSSSNISISVNAPNISEGMIPIKYDSYANNGAGSWLICSSDDLNWYNYSCADITSTTNYTNSKWANVMLSDGRYKSNNGIITDSNTSTKITVNSTTTYQIDDKDIGSMFVWIPRFAYKIENNLSTSNSGKISIKFLKGTTNKDFNEVQVNDTYPNVTNNAMDDYVVHPVFTNNIANGGWNSEISGFWVAKFPAGYQASTIDASGNLQNGTDTISRSKISYSGIDNSYTANSIDSSLNANTKISYPVFKPLTYAYNCIRIGDIYSISRDIQNSSFYGLDNVDSHMEKNSEWCAVAYLAQSNYGRNGEEINANSYNMNNSNSKNTYAVTGLYSDGTSADNITLISSLSAYNTSTGIKGSSTGNITGVYDLNGCIWEMESAYLADGNLNLSNYASSFAYSTTADTSPQINNRSTRWATTYPYDSTSDDETKNWINYNSLKSLSYGFGDAILEISCSNGTECWNSDYSHFINVARSIFKKRWLL